MTKEVDGVKKKAIRPTLTLIAVSWRAFGCMAKSIEAVEMNHESVVSKVKTWLNGKSILGWMGKWNNLVLTASNVSSTSDQCVSESHRYSPRVKKEQEPGTSVVVLYWLGHVRIQGGSLLFSRRKEIRQGVA